MRLVGVDSEQLGIVSLAEAIAHGGRGGGGSGRDRADGEAAGLPHHGLRQVQVPGSEEARTKRSSSRSRSRSRKSSSGPGTDEGDYKIKLRNLIRFLDEGDKTKMTLRFRGREMAHQEFGMRLLERDTRDLEPYGDGRAVSRRWKAGRWSCCWRREEEVAAAVAKLAGSCTTDQSSRARRRARQCAASSARNKCAPVVKHRTDGALSIKDGDIVICRR